eukprot:11208771-Lingulodinium_polyedra.AAC.1
MTTKSWAKLCMKVAEKDLSNLQGVFEVAKDLCEKNKSEDSEESGQHAADVCQPQRPGSEETEEGPGDMGCGHPHEDDQRGDRGLSNEASPNYQRTEVP